MLKNVLREPFLYMVNWLVMSPKECCFCAIVRSYGEEITCHGRFFYFVRHLKMFLLPRTFRMAKRKEGTKNVFSDVDLFFMRLFHVWVST